MLHLVGCLYYLYQWCTVKQISDNEIYTLIKYIKSVLWRVAKRLSYIEDACWLKVNWFLPTTSMNGNRFHKSCYWNTKTWPLFDVFVKPYLIPLFRHYLGLPNNRSTFLCSTKIPYAVINFCSLTHIIFFHDFSFYRLSNNRNAVGYELR